MNEAGRGAARRDPHPAADQRAAQRGRPVARQLRQVSQHHLQVDLRVLALEGEALLHGEQDLADAEQADHRDQEVEAAQQLVGAEGQAQLPGHAVQPDRRQREAQHHRAQDLGRRLLAHADEAAEGQEVDREEFRRPELQRELRDQGARKVIITTATTRRRTRR